MAFDLIPSSFWRFPNLPSLSSDEDWAVAPIGSPSGLSISEDDKHVYVAAAMPGVDPKDVEITFDKGVLWVKGETREEEKAKKFYRKASSAFSYRVMVPGDIDDKTEPEATNKHGVVTVVFVKKPQAQPKKITIK